MRNPSEVAAFCCLNLLFPLLAVCSKQARPRSLVFLERDLQYVSRSFCTGVVRHSWRNAGFAVCDVSGKLKCLAEIPLKAGKSAESADTHSLAVTSHNCPLALDWIWHSGSCAPEGAITAASELAELRRDGNLEKEQGVDEETRGSVITASVACRRNVPTSCSFLCSYTSSSMYGTTHPILI